MSRFPMNPYDEQRLIQEVRYLHSLWHQGPPQPPQPHHHHPHPHPHPHPPTPLSLQPTSSTQFKKRNKNNSKRLKESEFQDSGIEWTCKSPAASPPVTESGWPSFKPQPNVQPHLPTAEELASFEANRVQQQALKAVSEYLKCSADGNDDAEDEGEDDEDDMDVEKREKNVSFFAKLFEEDGGLKEYYVKNCESVKGEFSCLVCSGVGKKGWRKRFKDCVGLVQHSITIANRREAHRGYGQVICRVLGWDINRLPSIVLSAGDKTSESSGKQVEAQVLGSGLQTSSLASSDVGSHKTLQGNKDAGGKDGVSGLSRATDTVDIGGDELSQQKQSFSNENQQENVGGSTTLEHNSPVEASVSNVIPETAEENREDVLNFLGNEGDGGKNSLSGQSNTTDPVNIGSNELSQQKETSGNENQEEIGGFSTTFEHNSMTEANANRSLEDITNDTPETAKENVEGAANFPEPLPDDMIVANEENNDMIVSEETTIVSDMS